MSACAKTRGARIAGRPAEAVVPEPVRRLAAGDPVRPVWRNELGGLTFAVGGDRYIKWAPAGSGIGWAGEVARLGWAGRFLPVPEPLNTGHDSAGSWLVTRALAGTNAVDSRWLARPELAVPALGRGLRRLHDTLPVLSCPFSWSTADRIAAIDERARLGPLDPGSWHAEHAGQPIPMLLRRLADPPPDDRLVVCHGDACAPNVLLDDAAAVAGYVDLC